jgi:hypothetical protein
MTSFEQETKMCNSVNTNRSVQEEYKTTHKERQVIKTFASKLRSVKRQMLLKEAQATSKNSPVDDFRKLLLKITETDNLHDSQRDIWASSSFSLSSSSGGHPEEEGAGGSWTSSSSNLHQDAHGSFHQMNTPHNSLLQSFTRG